MYDAYLNLIIGKTGQLKAKHKLRWP